MSSALFVVPRQEPDRQQQLIDDIAIRFNIWQEQDKRDLSAMIYVFVKNSST